jgi:GcrA cell cycle regulator
MNEHVRIPLVKEYTPEDRELIRQMARDGYSYSQIARVVGRTRSAIAGFLHREAPGAKRTIRRAPSNKRSDKVNPQMRAPLPAKANLPPLEQPLRLQVEELKPRSCRWPFGDPGASDFGFCGHETHAPGQSYCAHHQRLAWHA